MDIWQACQFGNVSKVLEFIQQNITLVNKKDNQNASPLHWASINGHVAIIQLLVEWGADLDTLGGENSSTSLHWATSKGHINAISLLITLGANCLLRDDNGYSLLHIAAQNGKIYPLLLFYALGMDVNCIDKTGKTPLMWAAIQNNVEIMAFLLEVGCDPDKEDFLGWTVLHFAVRENAQKCFRFFLTTNRRGYSSAARLLSSENNEGLTPIQLAIAKKEKWFLHYLLDTGRGESILENKEQNWFCFVTRPTSYFNSNTKRITIATYLIPHIGIPIIFFVLSKIVLYVAIPLIAVTAWTIQAIISMVIFKYIPMENTPLLTGIFQASVVISICHAFWMKWKITGTFLNFSTLILWWFSLISMCWFYVKVVNNSPGFVQKMTDERRVKRTILDLAGKNQLDGRHYCYTCCVKKPLRSKHCKICDRCVVKFDHHCPWINNCIGWENFSSFYYFLMCQSVYIVVCICMIYQFLSFHADNAVQNSPRGFNSLINNYYYWLIPRWIYIGFYQFPFSIYWLLYLTINCGWIVVLLVIQTWQISIGLTTNEYIVYDRLEYLHQDKECKIYSNPFDEGPWMNLIKFFCPAILSNFRSSITTNWYQTFQ